MSTVMPTAPINPLPVVADNTIPKAEERHDQLPIDKFVRATVAEGGQERVILDLNHRLVPAETRVPLKTGQQLNLLVTATTPKLELLIIDDPLQRRLTGLLHHLGGKLQISSLIQQLTAENNVLLTSLRSESRQALLSLLGLEENALSGLTGRSLEQFIANLGLDFEALLAKERHVDPSLKSIILEILAKLDSGKTNFNEQAVRLLQGLELQQLCQIKLARQDMFFFPLPFDFLEQGFVIAEQPKESQEEPSKKSFVLSMHLALKGLGNLRIDFFLDAKGLYLRFACESKEKMEFSAQFENDLHNAIQTIPVQGISFSTGADDPAATLISKLITHGDSVLDTRV